MTTPTRDATPPAGTPSARPAILSAAEARGLAEGRVT